MLFDSEGLLILTNDKKINQCLLNPNNLHKKEYWVQVEGLVNAQAIEKLTTGVIINIDGKNYKTKPSIAKIINNPKVCERTPPIRFRKDIPTSWISITLTEGKNRQVRKMTAVVGFPTLRLIRNRIENICVAEMQPGDIIQISKSSIYKKLFNE